MLFTPYQICRLAESESLKYLRSVELFGNSLGLTIPQLMAICGSAYSLTKTELLDLSEEWIKFRPLKYFMNCFIKSTFKGEGTPSFIMPKISSFDNTSWNNVTLVDGGLNCNIPLRSLFDPNRGVEKVVIFDSGAEVEKDSKTLRRALELSEIFLHETAFEHTSRIKIISYGGKRIVYVPYIFNCHTLGTEPYDTQNFFYSEENLKNLSLFCKSLLVQIHMKLDSWLNDPMTEELIEYSIYGVNDDEAIIVKVR